MIRFAKGISAIPLVAVTAIVGCAAAAAAQNASATDFPDVPQNHWAYQAVHDLADKGLVKGYPDGKFLGDRALTRFEFATVVERLLETVDDMKAGSTPTTGVTQDDLNKIQVLVDKFQPQLDAIQADVTKAQADIDALRQNLDDLRQDVEDTKDMAAKAQDTANHSYGTTLNRKFSITGLVEARVIAPSDTSNRTEFPQGTSATGAGGAGPVNGTYDQGSSGLSAQVRRARIIMNGAPTNNTAYKVQLDVSGPVTAGPGVTANSQVSVLEAWGQYTLGDGSSKYPSIAAGAFANPYGWILPASPAAWLTPERPVAFSEAKNVGMWDSQDYDKGVRVIYAPNNFRFVYAAVNGAGRQSENVDNHLDSIFHVGYTSNDKQYQIGASYYDGYITRVASSTTSISFPMPKKQLGGIDAEVNLKNGVFVQGEYIAGTYEKRAYYDQNLTTAAAPLGATVLQVDPYVKDNKANGYYVWGGYTWHQTSIHPFTVGVDYDVFNRSTSSSATDTVTASGQPYYASGSSFADKNWGFGAMYNLDKATRLRLWYDTPTAVSHAPGTPEPPHIGLYTAEMLTRF